MTYSHTFLFIGISILCCLVSWSSGHAYFINPTPRSVYCSNSSCTTNGTIGRQGALWGLPANTTLDAVSALTQQTCNGSILLTNASMGDTYDPGFKGTTSASWPAGSSQTFQIFISELHPRENQTVYPTDGWQIRYRDGTKSDSKFSPIPFIYEGVSSNASIGPASATGFQLGQTVLAKITVPSTPTTDGIFQFFWRNNQGRNGTMWLSCVDITITSDGTIRNLSTFTIVVAALLIAVNMVFNM